MQENTLNNYVQYIIKLSAAIFIILALGNYLFKNKNIYYILVYTPKLLFYMFIISSIDRYIKYILTTFSDIRKTKESHIEFDKISNLLDAALSRNSQATKSKPAEMEEAQKILNATQSCFRLTALDHVYTISITQAKKRHEILGMVCFILNDLTISRVSFIIISKIYILFFSY